MRLAILTSTPDWPLLSKYFWKAKLRLLIGKSRGPQAVVASLMRGLNILEIDYKLNPAQEEIFASDVVWVNESIDALRWAVRMKRLGRIRKLIAGPNLVVLPSDFEGLITAPEIDRYLVVSDWTYAMYAEEGPELQSRLEIWPAGVDEKFWTPGKDTVKSKRVIVYQKIPDTSVIDECVRKIRGAGFEVSIIKYNQYNRDEYLRLLQASQLLVYFNYSESQGIALAESWSANVPTFVWNPGELNIERSDGVKTFKCTSAPFLTPETGRFFIDESGFESLFSEWQRNREQYAPRQWILKNMTDKICAEKFLKIIEINEQVSPIE